MIEIVKYSDIASYPGLKFKGYENVQWKGIEVKVIKFSMRKSTLIERILDFILLIFIGITTLGAALEFPCVKRLWKSAFKGRNVLFYVNNASFG